MRIACFSVGLLLATALFVEASGRETAQVENAIQVIREFSSIPESAIPRSVLANAQGIAVIPNVVRGGFIVGGRFGRGVILMRDEAGNWSNPVFVGFGGGSVGFQAGVASSDVVLVFKRRETVEAIMHRQKITLGAGVGVAAGPVGRNAEAGTDAQMRAEIFSYARSRGLFAGVQIEGSVLRVDFRANADFYGNPIASPSQILRGEIPAPPIAEELRRVLYVEEGLIEDKPPQTPPGGPVVPGVPVIPPGDAIVPPVQQF